MPKDYPTIVAAHWKKSPTISESIHRRISPIKTTVCLGMMKSNGIFVVIQGWTFGEFRRWPFRSRGYFRNSQQNTNVRACVGKHKKFVRAKNCSKMILEVFVKCSLFACDRINSLLSHNFLSNIWFTKNENTKITSWI